MTTAAVLTLPRFCPPWCTTVHDDPAAQHTSDPREVGLSTCHHRRAEEHLAYERDTADRLGYPVLPLRAAITAYLTRHPAGSVARVWLGLDDSSDGYHLTVDEVADLVDVLRGLLLTARSDRLVTLAQKGVP